MNDDKYQYRSNKTKEVMPKYLSFVKRVVDIDDLLPLNVNRETLQEFNIIKVIYNKILRKAIDILRNLAEKDEYKEEKNESNEEKDNNIDDEKTKEVEINKNGEVANTVNEKLVVDAANDAPTPQDTPTTTTTTEAAANEGRDDYDLGSEDGDNEDEAEDT